MTTDAPLGNLDFDDMLRYVESGHNNNTTTTTLVKSTITSAITTSKFHISPRKPLENHLPIPPIVQDQISVKSMDGGSRMQQQSTKAQKRQVKKGRASYESDDDAQIAMRLARLRREVLEQQEEVEAEEVVNNEHEQTDGALERLRSFRESLGIPEPQQRPNNSSATTATPKQATKMISKRRYSSSSSDKSLGGSGGRKEFESPAEVSEAQLLYRLQKLRQSLTSPERSKGSASSKSSQRASAKKKRIQYLPSHAAAATNAAAELFSTSQENQQVVVQDAAMLHPGLAKEIQQHWSMDLNNVMHMGFSMDQGGPVVDQFVGHGHLHQYAQ